MLCFLNVLCFDIRYVPNVTRIFAKRVSFDKNYVMVVDDAAGIDFETAQHEVFRFGHSDNHTNARDRLPEGLRSLKAQERFAAITEDYGKYALAQSPRDLSPENFP